MNFADSTYFAVYFSSMKLLG